MAMDDIFSTIFDGEWICKIIEIMELRILHDYFIESTSIVIPEHAPKLTAQQLNSYLWMVVTVHFLMSFFGDW